jgi:hypothetical protein
MPEPADSARTSESDRFNNAIAIIVALISAFLAVASIKGDNVVQAMQRRQALLTDSWNQYQPSASGSSSSISRCSGRRR